MMIFILNTQNIIFWTNDSFFLPSSTLASFNLSLNNNVQVGDLLQTLDFYPLTSLSEKKCAKDWPQNHKMQIFCTVVKSIRPVKSWSLCRGGSVPTPAIHKLWSYHILVSPSRPLSRASNEGS